MQMLSGGNPAPQQQINNNGIMGKLGQIAQITQVMRSGNSEQLLKTMLDNNAKLSKFVKENKNKPLEQICGENGLNVKDVQATLSMLGL